MHCQFGVLNEAGLAIVSTSDNPQQAWVGCRVIIRIIDKDFHLATDALEACRRRQCNDIIGVAIWLVILHRLIDRLPGEERSKTVSGDLDFNTIGVDFHTACKRHEGSFDLVRCLGREFFCDLMATFNQVALSRTAARFVQTAGQAQLC